MITRQRRGEKRHNGGSKETKSTRQREKESERERGRENFLLWQASQREMRNIQQRIFAYSFFAHVPPRHITSHALPSHAMPRLVSYLTETRELRNTAGDPLLLRARHLLGCRDLRHPLLLTPLAREMCNLGRSTLPLGRYFFSLSFPRTFS